MLLKGCGFLSTGGMKVVDASKYVFQGKRMMQDTVGSIAEGQRQICTIEHSEEGKEQCC